MPVDLKAMTALALWREVTLEGVRSDQPDLTQRQLAILLHVYLQPPPHTVRGLAQTLKVTKPAITRALDTLGRLQLLKRRRDETDRAHGQWHDVGRADKHQSRGPQCRTGGK